MRRAATCALGLALWLAAGVPAAGAGPLDPVRLTVTAPRIASLDRALAVSVTVQADPGAFSQTASDLRLRVRLSAECASTFAGTPGPVLIDRVIGAVPTSDAGFDGRFTGAGRPGAYGPQVVCAFLEEQGSNRLYAMDDSTTVDVSLACTSADRAATRAARTVGSDRRALRNAHGARRRRLAARLRRASRALVRANRRRVLVCA